MKVNLFEKLAHLPLYDRHLSLLRNSVYGWGVLCHLMMIVQSIVFIVALCTLPITIESFYDGPLGVASSIFFLGGIILILVASTLSSLFLWKAKESKLRSALKWLWLSSHLLFLGLNIIASIVIQIGLNHG